MRLGKTGYLIVALGFLGFPGETWAQASLNGAISGTVRDTTGGVLPGVQVEAASPALIEKVRSVVTDGQGVYRIVDLRPGTYVVTFTLPGFGTVRREGIELNAGFTATVNADLRPGALEETVVVSAASPIVDAQNARTQNVLTREVLDSVPTGKNFQGFIALTLGASSTSTDGSRDVAGDQGESVYAPKIHGGTAGLVVVEGLRVNGIAYASVAAHRYTVNQLAVQEVVTETGGITAESEVGGLNVNMTFRDGGNRFTGEYNGDFTNGSLQSSNVNDTLRARGLNRSNNTDYVYDQGFGVGGPLKRDRVWFYAANRWQGSAIEIAGAYFNANPNKLFYVPDLTHPNLTKRNVRDHTQRLTWQATPKHKFAFISSVQEACHCNWYANQNRGPKSGEADYDLIIEPNNLFQATWTFPATNRLLFSGQANYRPEHQHNGVPPEARGQRSVLELSTGLEYGSLYPQPAYTPYDVYGDQGAQVAWSSAFSASYITGSHAIKAGVTTMKGYMRWGGNGPEFPDGYQFRNQIPVGIFQGAFAADCCSQSNLKIDLGLFVQDQWTIKRLTLNPGVRFDYVNAYNPAQTRPAGPYTPEFHFARVDNVPNWKDVSPRIGAAFDLFGNGKTAIKASIGRYVTYELVSIANRTNGSFTISATTTRTWADGNGDYVPDCDLRSPLANGECGAMANQTFGTQIPTTALSSEYTEGWGVRPGVWQTAVALQHELMPRLGFTAAWYRTSYFNFTVTDNLAVGPADFSEISPFPFVAPGTAPGSGNYTIAGLHDINPGKFGQVDNLVRPASDFGDQSQVYNGIEFQLNGRLSRGHVGGGVILARTVFDRCFVVDSPVELRDCRTVLNWTEDAQVKLSGSYELPWGIQAAATLQNLPGIPIPSNYSFPNSMLAPHLGRNLGQCGTSAVCNGTITTNVATPNTLFERRETQLDLRFGRMFRTARLVIRPRLDIYNVLNESSVQRLIGTVGSSWQQPLVILGGRTVKFGAQITF